MMMRVRGEWMIEVGTVEQLKYWNNTNSIKVYRLSIGLIKAIRISIFSIIIILGELSWYYFCLSHI